MGKANEITGFGGVICAYEKIPNNHSADQVNVRTEDGTIRPRFGYNKLRDPQGSFQAVLGLEYLHGYDASRVEQEELVSFETIGGNTRAYSNNVNTGAATEIKNGVSSVNLHASEWVAATFRGDAFFINPNNTSPVYRHAIGDATSLTAIAVPDAPTVAPTYIVNYGPGGSVPYSQVDYAGIDPTSAGEVACTGAATNTGSSLLSDNTLSIRHTNNKVESSFEIDLNDGNAGVQDFTYRDKFGITLTAETSSFNFQVDRIEFRNNDGSPITKVPSTFKQAINTSRPAGTSGNSYAFYFDFIDKIRADFDNIRYIKVVYTVTQASSTVANNDLIVSKLVVGGIDLVQSPTDRTPGTAGLYLAYSYYFSTPQFESGLSPVLFIPNSVLAGTSIQSGGLGASLPPLGVTLEMTATVSADGNVDNIRFYVFDNIDQVFRRLATQADSDLTYDVRISYSEIHRLTEFAPAPFAFANAVAAFSHKGSMVWLYKGGRDNLRGSRQGDALRQADPSTDTDEDLNRGRTMSLSDDFGDEPLGGVSLGGAFMVAGKVGIYVSFGDYPAQWTPIRKIDGSTGAAGKYAFCRWKDDSGITGMVYVSQNGQVYFAVPVTDTGDVGKEQIQLSEVIREGVKSLKTFLLDEQRYLGLTDFSTVQVRVDARDNEVVIAMGKRAIKLKRPDLRGVRSWDPEDYNTGSDTATIRFLASSTKYGIRWMRSTGQLDEDNYNNAARQYIEGVDRDGGNPMPPAYWKTQLFTGENRRILRVLADRTPARIDQRIRVHSQRKTQVYKILAYRGFAKCLPEQQGRLHAFEIMVNEETGAISRLHWDESMLSRRLGA